MHTDQGPIQRPPPAPTHLYHTLKGPSAFLCVLVGRYAPVLARVSSHAELMDLMGELQGELGASHAYVEPPEMAGDETTGAQGTLGLVTEWADSERGWRIVALCTGDVWEVPGLDRTERTRDGQDGAPDEPTHDHTDGWLA